MLPSTRHMTDNEKQKVVDFVNLPDVDNDVILTLVKDYWVNDLIHWSITKRRICFDKGIVEPPFSRDAFIAILQKQTIEDQRKEFSEQLAKLLLDTNNIPKVKNFMKHENHGAIDNVQLVTIIERIERLKEDHAAISADIKEIFSEAKSAGFDPKYIKKVIKARKKDPDELQEELELTKLYSNATGVQMCFDI